MQKPIADTLPTPVEMALCPEVVAAYLSWRENAVSRPLNVSDAIVATEGITVENCLIRWLILNS